METVRSSETSALTRATRLSIPENAILESHHSENLKAYTVPTLQMVCNESFISHLALDAVWLILTAP
jgi:hypothetical protein